MSTPEYDETTGLLVHPREAADPVTSNLHEEARQPTQYWNAETGEYDTDPLDGVEGVDWEWDTSGGDDYEPEDDTYDFAALHSCQAKLPHTGYSQAVTTCLEDRFGRLWLFDSTGRRGTQAKFCPFCGFQCLDDSAPDRPVHVTPQDIALVPADKPTAVWVHYKQRIMMMHFQFGTVKVLASDGCHSKVLTLGNVQMTVCVENLSPLKGERTLPKFGKKEYDGPSKRKRGEVDPELMAKYLDMGL